MQEHFNPYRQWLGRDGGLPPTGPRELLGLAEGETDPEAIARAADTLTARIRQIRPGPHLVDWQQLLDRIAAAKATLLRDAENRPTAASSPRCTADSVSADSFQEVTVHEVTHEPTPGAPPLPTYRASPIGPLNIPLPPLANGLLQPLLPLLAPSTPHEEAAAAPTPNEPLAASPPSATQAARSLAGWDRETILVVVVAGIVVVCFTAWMVQSRQPPTATSQETPAEPASSTAATERTPPPGNAVSQPPAATAVLPTTVPAAVPTAASPGSLKTPGDGASPRPPALPENDSTRPATPSTEKPPPKKPGVAKDPSEEPAEPTSSEPSNDTPKSKPGPIAPAKFDPERQAAFRRQIASARAAMSARNLPVSRRSLAAARKAAQTSAEETEVTRLETLAGNLEEFWKAMSQLLPRLMPAQELSIAGKPMIVVESGRNLLTLRCEGRSVRYSLQTLPRSVVEAIAREGLAKDPSSLVLLGTFLAFDRQGDRRLARQLWESASQQGHDVSDLMPELDQ